jgi:uncharacterized protein DUF6458
MRIGLSLILVAIGAVLTWAVNATVSGVDIKVVGVILMVVGAIGIILSLLTLESLRGPGGTRRRDVVTGPNGDQTVRDSYTSHA